MPLTFWIRRYFTILLGAFVLIGIAQYLRGHAWADVAGIAAFWATISATLFTVVRYWQARRGQHCALCRDTPDMR